MCKPTGLTGTGVKIGKTTSSFRPRVAFASPPRPSPLERIRDGLTDQGVQPRGDVEPVPDLGSIPSCPGRVVQPTGEAVRAGLGQVGGQAEPAAIDDGFDDVNGWDST